MGCRSQGQRIVQTNPASLYRNPQSPQDHPHQLSPRLRPETKSCGANARSVPSHGGHQQAESTRETCEPQAVTFVNPFQEAKEATSVRSIFRIRPGLRQPNAQYLLRF